MMDSFGGMGGFLSVVKHQVRLKAMKHAQAVSMTRFPSSSCRSSKLTRSGGWKERGDSS
jgi:hypothetical protein